MFTESATFNFFFKFSVIWTFGKCGHYIIPGAMPYDGYHDLHLPHDPPLYPTLWKVPQTKFTCDGKINGYYADVDAACQASICKIKSKTSDNKYEF